MDDYYRNLLDEFACRRLIERYWRALSEHDADGIAGVFTAQGQWGPARGEHEIRNLTKHIFAALGTLRFMSTHVGSIRMTVDGDTATAAIEGIAHHVVDRDAVPTVVVANALYYLRYVREQGEWRIASMTGKDDPEALHDAAYQFDVPMAAIDYGLPTS